MLLPRTEKNSYEAPNIRLVNADDFRVQSFIGPVKIKDNKLDRDAFDLINRMYSSFVLYISPFLFVILPPHVLIYFFPRNIRSSHEQ